MSLFPPVVACNVMRCKCDEPVLPNEKSVDRNRDRELERTVPGSDEFQRTMGGGGVKSGLELDAGY